MRVPAHLKAIDDLERCRIDDVDVVRLQMGHVDARRDIGDRRAQVVRSSLAVEVPWVNYRRHPRYGLDAGRPLRACGPGAEGNHEACYQETEARRRVHEHTLATVGG